MKKNELPLITNSIKAGFCEISLSGMIAIDKDAIIIYANDSAYELFQYTPDELLGKQLTDLMPERFREAHDKNIERYRGHPEKRVMGENKAVPKLEILGLTKFGKEIELTVNISGKYHLDLDGFIGYAVFTAAAKVLEANK